MAVEYRAHVGADGRFLYWATSPYVPLGLAPGELSVVLPREPQPNEKYSGDPLNPFLVKTAQEMTADAAVKLGAAANSRFSREHQAMAAALFKNASASTGAFPTPAQKAQLLADFVTAWKALG